MLVAPRIVNDVSYDVFGGNTSADNLPRSNSLVSNLVKTGPLST